MHWWLRTSSLCSFGHIWKHFWAVMCSCVEHFDWICSPPVFSQEQGHYRELTTHKQMVWVSCYLSSFGGDLTMNRKSRNQMFQWSSFFFLLTSNNVPSLLEASLLCRFFSPASISSWSSCCLPALLWSQGAEPTPKVAILSGPPMFHIHTDWCHAPTKRPIECVIFP